MTGPRVWLTRPEPHDEESARAWSARGATVLRAPTVDVVPVSLTDEERTRIDALDDGWLLLPSPRAAENLVAAIGPMRDGAPRPCATVGPATSARARALGLDVRFEAPRATGVDLARALLAIDAPSTFVLASSDRRRQDLGRELRAAGRTVIDVVVHRTVPVHELPAAVRRALASGLDVIALYSPSAAAFVDELSADGAVRVRALVAACMGASTADAAARAGFTRVVAPDDPGERAMIDAVLRGR